MRLCREEGCSSPAEHKQSRCSPHRNERRRSRGRNFLPLEGAKILFVDIETTPSLVWTWDIWNVNIGIDQIVKPGGMMCFAAKWQGLGDVQFFSEWDDGSEDMVLQAWKLLDDADIVIHFYGSRFDIPHLNTEFLKLGFPPPSPFKQIDLKMAVSKKFKLVSNKLQFVSTVLGLEGKEEHEGFPLWTKCMDRDPDALERMESYNRRDVTLLEEVYEILLPWIPSHPSRHLYEVGAGCPTCGANVEVIVEAGYATTKLSKFKQFRCTVCGSFFRSSRREEGVSIQESIF